MPGMADDDIDLASNIEDPSDLFIFAKDLNSTGNPIDREIAEYLFSFFDKQFGPKQAIIKLGLILNRIKDDKSKKKGWIPYRTGATYTDEEASRWGSNFLAKYSLNSTLSSVAREKLPLPLAPRVTQSSVRSQ